MNAIPTPNNEGAADQSRRKERAGEGGQGLVNKAPFLALLARIEAEADAVDRRAPHSDLASCLRSHHVELKRALDESGDVNVWLTVPQVAEKIGRPPSTLRRIFRDHGEKAGAEKRGGVWSIYWPKFQEFWTNNHQQTR